MDKQISELGEFGLLERLEPILAPTLDSQIIGMGDDCAVLPVAGGRFQLLTTDTLLDDVHFRRCFSTPYDIGWKSIAVSLSDVAAMGGTPEAATVALMLSDEIDIEFVEQLYCGLSDAAESAQVAIVGGDTVHSKQFGVSITLLGSCGKAPLLREGAVDGSSLWVSGTIGAAEAGLRFLQSGASEAPALDAPVLLAHRRPVARVALGKRLLEDGLATAAIDISDGLLQDLGHLVRASGVGARLQLAEIPVWSDESIESRIAAVCGGDDYELLFSVPLAVRSAIEALGKEKDMPQLSCVGEFTSAVSGIEIELPDGSRHESTKLLAKHSTAEPGYQHFSRGSIDSDE